MGVHILHPNFRGVRAFGRDFEVPTPPLDVYDTFPKWTSTQLTKLKSNLFSQSLMISFYEIVVVGKTLTTAVSNAANTCASNKRNKEQVMTKVPLEAIPLS